MGYSADMHAEITFPAAVTPEKVFAATGAAVKPTTLTEIQGDEEEAWRAVMVAIDLCDASDDVYLSGGDIKSGLTVSFSSYGKVGTWTTKAFEAIAKAGGHGHAEFRGEDGARWVVAVENGAASEHFASTFYPTMPGNDTPVLPLTRAEVRTCVAFLCGEDDGGRAALLARLTAALNV